MEPNEVERFLRDLFAMMQHSQHIHDDLRTAIAELQECNRQQLGISERLIRLLESSTGQGENGHEGPDAATNPDAATRRGTAGDLPVAVSSRPRVSASP
jgi:hypothetical protein